MSKIKTYAELVDKLVTILSSMMILIEKPKDKARKKAVNKAITNFVEWSLK